MVTVFVADDEKWMREEISSSIDWEAHGFILLGEAGDGLETLEMLHQLKPDIVLADIQMPGLDGIELLRKVKDTELNCVFIYLSGYDRFDYARNAVNLGALGYVLKPVDEKELLELLLKAKDHVLAERQKMLPNEKLADLSTRLLQQRQAAAGFKPDYYVKLAESVKKYIEEHYSGDISLESVAMEFKFHPNYLCKLFKDELGVNFIDYVTGLRIEKARELLEDIRYTVYDAAEKVGYKDAKYFTKVFKKVVGITPSEYMGKVRK